MRSRFFFYYGTGTNMDIKYIAKQAQVSIATVSRVLNNSKPVSDELRERVLAVIEREDYSPSHLARSMVYQRTGTVGLVLPDVSPLFHHQIFRNIEQSLEAAEYRLIVCHVQNKTDSELSYLDLLRHKKVDGIILMQETEHTRVREWLSTSSVPIVQCSVRIPGLDRPAVGVHEYQAAYDGTEYLISLGHRHIGFIRGHGHAAGELRTSGYQEAIEFYGIEVRDRYLEQGEYSLEGGKQAMIRLLSLNPEISAVFAASDEMAIGAMREAQEQGLRVPEDISFLGFDGIDMGAFINPSLSTMYQSIDEIGKTSVQILLDQLENQRLLGPDIVLPHRLIVRESTGPPPHR